MNQPDPAWQPSPAVVAWLLTVSPQNRLRTLLAHSGLDDGDRQGPATIPLSDLQSSAPGQYQYRTAIAHSMAAAQKKPVLAVAAAIAQQFTAYAAQHPDAIATGLVAQAHSTGDIELTLSPPGVAAWWRQCHQGDRPDNTPAVGLLNADRPHPGQWPLGDRLQLSLPLLVQWAYSRCLRWTVDAPAMALSDPGTKTQLADPLTAVLQPVIIHGWDQLAAQPDAPQRWQRVGYRLAQTIYELEAQRSRWQPISATCPEAAITVVIAQAWLALLLRVLTGARPVSDL